MAFPKCIQLTIKSLYKRLSTSNCGGIFGNGSHIYVWSYFTLPHEE